MVNMNILFSPLGMTDPVRFFKDGAMLNIARNYKPDVIYLYMSKEIVKLHHQDNRYEYCIKELGKLINKDIKVETIEKPELENVQIFDSFLSEFRNILNQIHNENPDAQILLNVSSGTPAMKSSLQILSLTLDFECTPVQVSTPQKSSNPHCADESSLKPEEQWELNESNEKDDNRCIESKTENLMTEFKKQMIQKLILSYDYSSAYKMTENSSVYSEKFRELLSAACKRMKLNYSATITIFRKYGINIISCSNKEINNISEYLLLLKLKIIKEEYADFIRAITPVLLNLCIIYLKRKCNIDVSDYTDLIKKDFPVWKRSKLENTEILSFLDKKYHGQLKDDSPLSSDSLIEIISNVPSDPDVKLCTDNLRKIEREIRNSAAHTIVSITDDDINKISGFSSDDILKMLKTIFIKSGYVFEEKAYDKMNNYILDEL